jgi:TatD DNase family protein
MSVLPKLIDSHCHLNYDFDGKTIDQLIQEAKAQGVETLIAIGVEIDKLSEVQALADKYSNIYFTAGQHPHEANQWKPGDEQKLYQYLKHPKCVAVGELGIDYYYDLSDREAQKNALKIQLDLALKTQKPVVVHSREGEDDLFALLSNYAHQVPSQRSPGVIHCFTGSRTFGQKCLDLGFYISFSGILTFKNAVDLQASAKAFPIDRILIETDAPYLAPIPYRGKKCEPSMVKQTAIKLAELKGMSLDECSRITSENTKRLFGLPNQ